MQRMGQDRLEFETLGVRPVEHYALVYGEDDPFDLSVGAALERPRGYGESESTKQGLGPIAYGQFAFDFSLLAAQNQDCKSRA
jgi:hypothetical protein